MGFIDKDERIIIMDIANPLYIGKVNDNDYSLTADDMKQLRDAGARTVSQPVYWDVIERDGSARNWEPVEVGLRKAEEAGMKVLLGCYQKPPQHMPADWYYRKLNGDRMGHFSIWNEEANSYEEAFVRELARRYASDTVLIQNTIVHDGETMFPTVHDVFWCDPAGSASWREYHGEGTPIDATIATQTSWLYESLLAKATQYQALLVELQPQHKTIWFQLHPMIRSDLAGTQFMPSLLPEMRGRFPGVETFWLLYTFYEFPEYFREEQISLASRHGVNLVVGAMHCQGLPKSVPQAKKSGIRLLCGPLNYVTQPEILKFEPWMAKKIAWAIKELSG
jgi:hypothetical protein